MEMFLFFFFLFFFSFCLGKISKRLYNLSKVFHFFIAHFQSKMRLPIKTTFHLLIGTVEFATQFKESPCSSVVTFPSFGSEGHGVSSHRGTPFFIFVSDPIFLFRAIFFFLVLTELAVKSLFKKGQQTLLTVKYVQLIMSFLCEFSLSSCIQFEKSCIRTYLYRNVFSFFWKRFNERLQKDSIT